MVEAGRSAMPERQSSVPLAKFDTEDWDEFCDFQGCKDANCNSPNANSLTAIQCDRNDNDFFESMSDSAETFKDTFSTSLEDLVNTFDEKITKCFHNYEDNVEKYAPVQVRSQEEIMNECQMWWTITGNFGNLLPIDWSKSYARKQFIPALNLNEAKKQRDGNLDSVTPSPLSWGADDEDDVAQDLDLHHLILQEGTKGEKEPVLSAEEVIKEIDNMMQDGSSSEDESMDVSKSSPQLKIRKLSSPLYYEKLEHLDVNCLNEAVMELDEVIRYYSETLITELARRDELEYEKELKNTFISLLLQVQNKRRNCTIDKKSKKPLGSTDGKYLTTVIPYDVLHGPPTNETLQILIKILTAINEDSPTVPPLLTDYILKVLCPS